MFWIIRSATGWTALAHTQDEARAKAEKHAQEWAEVGRTVKVEYWYNIGRKPEIFVV